MNTHSTGGAVNLQGEHDDPILEYQAGDRASAATPYESHRLQEATSFGPQRTRTATSATCRPALAPPLPRVTRITWHERIRSTGECVEAVQHVVGYVDLEVRAVVNAVVAGLDIGDRLGQGAGSVPERAEHAKDVVRDIYEAIRRRPACSSLARAAYITPLGLYERERRAVGVVRAKRT